MKLDTGVTVGREVGLLVASEVATQVAMAGCPLKQRPKWALKVVCWARAPLPA